MRINNAECIRMYNIYKEKNNWYENLEYKKIEIIKQFCLFIQGDLGEKGEAGIRGDPGLPGLKGVQARKEPKTKFFFFFFWGMPGWPKVGIIGFF